jgi:hypothetical protein
MEAQGERKYSSYLFMASALDGGEWSASRPGGAFTPGERTQDSHWTGGWMSPRASLGTEVRGKILLLLPGIEPRLSSRPVFSQALHWQSYPGSLTCFADESLSKTSHKLRRSFYIFAWATACCPNSLRVHFCQLLWRSSLNSATSYNVNRCNVTLL